MHKRDQNRDFKGLPARYSASCWRPLSLSSCESIYEDLAPCSHGVSLRFVYDYNMEYANAFPKKVDCLTLLIYDSGGNYVGMRTVTGPELQDETYRMQLDLEPGDTASLPTAEWPATNVRSHSYSRHRAKA